MINYWYTTQIFWDSDKISAYFSFFFPFSILIHLDESHNQQNSEVENLYFLFFVVLLILTHKEFF